MRANASEEEELAQTPDRIMNVIERRLMGAGCDRLYPHKRL